jgi:hypothetical protein
MQSAAVPRELLITGDACACLIDGCARTVVGDIGTTAVL